MDQNTLSRPFGGPGVPNNRGRSKARYEAGQSHTLKSGRIIERAYINSDSLLLPSSGTMDLGSEIDRGRSRMSVPSLPALCPLRKHRNQAPAVGDPRKLYGHRLGIAHLSSCIELDGFVQALQGCQHHRPLKDSKRRSRRDRTSIVPVALGTHVGLGRGQCSVKSKWCFSTGPSAAACPGERYGKGVGSCDRKHGPATSDGAAISRDPTLTEPLGRP